MSNTLDGTAIAETITAGIRQQVEALHRDQGVTPTLATVLVGEDPASKVYVKKKIKTCAAIGILSRHFQLPADSSSDDIRRTLLGLNEDPDIHGILLQMPLPGRLPAEELIEVIRPSKDVDGFHPYNMGRLFIGRPTFVPCTPAGIMELLDHSGVELAGKTAVVVGRSTIVGRPVGMLLLQRHATVIYCHSRTPDLPAVCRLADVLVVAAGRPGLVTGGYIKPGAVVVDVGINSVSDPATILRIAGEESSHWKTFQKTGRALVGDVEWSSVYSVAGAVTPVPGGIGPLTIALLMKNTLQACRQQRTQETVSCVQR